MLIIQEAHYTRDEFCFFADCATLNVPFSRVPRTVYVRVGKQIVKFDRICRDKKIAEFITPAGYNLHVHA
jgi:hypothetical protein